MSNSKDYTVGWICAISTEYVAAQAFLDENHDGPEYVSPNDNNDYTLGKVGRHNVVIAVLPDGEYGTTSAAMVARDMLHSFPNIRIGLMVGIGGGAPSPAHDIHLGDIVVSASRDGKGGVFQYDFGKTIQDQKFQTTGFLNQPPATLRTAMNGLKAQYELKGHQLETAISHAIQENPRLHKKYKRPGPSNERLYRSEITHPANDGTSCEIVCGNDPSKLVLRPKRSEDEDNLEVHYGLIASANQLMKDATVRDRLAAEMDVLCFEMEAAGLMSHFPCLVIRGICDYSDSHKNKEWQGYAAMAAAAYAKDLLCRIPPNKIEAEKEIRETLQHILHNTSRTEAHLEMMRHKLNNDEDIKILDWLTPIDYDPQQNDYLKRRQPGTGQWLLDSAEYQAWLKTKKQTLFCPGIPGAGKTILTAIVIDDLTTRASSDPAIGVAYIYCNFQQQGTQKIDDLMASLLKQLAQGQSSLPGSVKDLYGQYKTKRTRPLLDEILRVLQSVAKMYSRAFIIVDALDECQVSDDSRARFLSELFSLQTQHELNIFATSRPIPQIIGQLNGSVPLEIRAHNEDVRKYLDGRISQSESNLLKTYREKIKTEITKSVGGMFLLAQLYFDSIRTKKTPNKLEKALEGLPTGSQAYNHAYKDAMERIKAQDTDSRELAEHVLSWIICTKRHLTTVELQHALAVEVGGPELDEGNLTQIEDMVSVCAGLVTVDEETNIVRLVHYTTQEYFKQTQDQWFPNAENDIIAICVTYLSFCVFESGLCQTDTEFEERLRLNPLYDYAAHNWGYHARTASAEVEQLIIRLLESEAKVSSSIQAMMASRGYFNYSQDVPGRMTGVHLAAYFGRVEMTMALLESRHDLDSKDTYGRTPLSWAVESGHEAVVKLLLEKGAELETKEGRGRTPLSWAAEQGHEAVAKLLLEEGAELETKDKRGQTPLLWAARSGHEAVVKLLLEEGAELETKDISGQTPLSWAAEKGHKAVVKLLLEEGAELETKDEDYGQTPLLWAAEQGHEAVVKLLLEEGAKLETKDISGQTPLLWAAEKGHKAVVKLLLEEGAELETKDISGQTPLLWAIRYRHEAVVKLLLEKGAELETKDNSGQTPLLWAIKYGHEAVVKLLLEKGARHYNNP